MSIDPSSIVYFEWGFVRITATLVFTWIIMLVLTVAGILLTRNLTDQDNISKGQSILEALFVTIRNQIKSVSQQDAGKYLPFISTLFIFIMTSTILSIVPGFNPPTGSLNTTIALSLCVFFAVPFYGIQSQGIADYLKQYAKPSIVMLPFNIISEFSRVVSLAVRLYGNVMSSSIIVIILLGVVPFFFPVIIQMLGLLTGAIQAYIFAILAIVYIASATNKN
ncbi:F0F1 ATP synthase subunit A [Alkalibacter mobilis]|uniref:F0F1 ATP synthase subunit A n=1 Tax=Alkalibacter mobilis TaxID=2787712 RepID=UPI00189C8246|nr:F0F1 ATP synthase subunit A [Alkalibacter mobilis]MBF7096979.1 F0F1 ATP synthase subunit A [Alkalibacter mobilis]